MMSQTHEPMVQSIGVLIAVLVLSSLCLVELTLDPVLQYGLPGHMQVCVLLVKWSAGWSDVSGGRDE